MEHATLTVDILDLKVDAFLNAQATGVDGAQTNSKIGPPNAIQNAADFRNAQDHW
jgi:hypothetical protein